MIKRIISILLCVIVLSSFGFSAFASSYQTNNYTGKMETLAESFISGFLSYCGVVVRYVNNNGNSISSYDSSALYNLSVRFLNFLQDNYVDDYNDILFYMSDCGVNTVQSFNSTWQGSLKDGSNLIDSLISRFYNFISNYWCKDSITGDKDLFARVPLSLRYQVDSISLQGYSEVYLYDDDRTQLTDMEWYRNVGLLIQNYLLNNNVVEDDFEGLKFRYYWDYSSVPNSYSVNRVTYLKAIENYIDNFGGSSNIPSGPGDSSDSSSDTSSDNNSLGNGSSNNFSEDTIIFSRVFYKPFFLGLLRMFDIDFCRSEYTFDNPGSEGALLKYEMMPIIDHLYNVIMGYKSSYYVSNYYPTIKEDFLSICRDNFEQFYNAGSPYSFTFYPFYDSSGGFNRRFTLGFFELFCYEILDSPYFNKDTCFYFSHDSSLLLMFSLPVIDVEEELVGTYTFWKDYYLDSFVEFVVLCEDELVPIVIYKDVNSYFEEWLLNGQNFWYPYLNYFDFDKQQLFYFPGHNISHLLKFIIFTDSSSGSIQEFLSAFVLNTSDVVFFVKKIVDFLPIPLINVLFGGFIIVFTIIIFKLLI